MSLGHTNTPPPTQPSKEAAFRVVVNHEEQYSLWPAERELPSGWSDAGKVGTREECLAHIESVWTDMRPLSLRRAMDGPR
jgi:MbtH protein